MFSPLCCDTVSEWEWVDAATAALIHTLLKKHRVWICRLRKVGKNAYFFLPYLDCALLARWSGRQEKAVASGQCVLWFFKICLLYTSPSPRDRQKSRMPSS